MSGRLPSWFKKKMPPPGVMRDMRGLLKELSLHTVCENALCPNIGDCFCKGTATFLIMGDICTRNCTFCAITKGTPLPLDEKEPENLLEATEKLGLKHVVITSVTRDDLADGGAEHFARIISLLKEKNASRTVEVLVPDFGGSTTSLKKVIASKPDVFNHNLETVPRLYTEVRPRANFERSLQLLKDAKDINPNITTKSGLMAGLGETSDELYETMERLRGVGCDLLTIGQYLQPSTKHHPVIRFTPPEEFNEYEQWGIAMGFKGIASAPLVRSSFNAAELYDSTKKAGE